MRELNPGLIDYEVGTVTTRPQNVTRYRGWHGNSSSVG